MRLANCRDRRRRMCAFYCTYCRKAFSTRQARRNHFSVHQEELKLRRRLYHSHYSDNPIDNSGTVLIPPTNIQSENHGGDTRQTMPLFNLEASPSSFSHDKSPVNVDNTTTNNPTNATSHLIVHHSSNDGSTKFFHSNSLSTATVAQIGDGTTSLNTPIAFSSGPSSFGGGNEVSPFAAAEEQTSQGGKPIILVNPLQNLQYPNLSKFPNPACSTICTCSGLVSVRFPGLAVTTFPCRLFQFWGQKRLGQSNLKNASNFEVNKKPYVGDVPEDAHMTNISRRREVTRSPQTVQSEDRLKKELLLFKDVSSMVVSSDAEEEVQIDLDLSLHL